MLCSNLTFGRVQSLAKCPLSLQFMHRALLVVCVQQREMLGVPAALSCAFISQLQSVNITHLSTDDYEINSKCDIFIKHAMFILTNNTSAVVINSTEMKKQVSHNVVHYHAQRNIAQGCIQFTKLKLKPILVLQFFAFDNTNLKSVSQPESNTSDRHLL